MAVYLVHQSGLVLGSYVEAGMKGIDEDLLGANLRALLQFVEHTPLGGGSSITSITSGEFRMTVERGGHCDLVVITHGAPTEPLHNLMRVIVTRIESLNHEWLPHWRGQPVEPRGFEEAIQRLVGSHRAEPRTHPMKTPIGA
jgi:hypothetical protein